MQFFSTKGALRGALPAALWAVALTACETPSDVHTHGSPILNSDQAVLQEVGTGNLSELAKSVRAATARYHSPVQAARAGYVDPGPDECVAVPALGGMGYHWANFGLVDDNYDPMVPEVLLYEPGPQGQPHLVAVEYIVLNLGQAAPTFGGQTFDVGGTPVPAPHWSLHVWVHKNNPNGLFTPFNPTVSCPAA